MKIKIFVHDLLTFQEERLLMNFKPGAPGSQFYLSETYFNLDEINKLLSFPCGTGLNFEESLRAVFLNREMANSKSADTICSSHDLAPQFMNVFQIQKGFREEKLFKSSIKQFAKDLKKSKNQT